MQLRLNLVSWKVSRLLARKYKTDSEAHEADFTVVMLHLLDGPVCKRVSCPSRDPCLPSSITQVVPLQLSSEATLLYDLQMHS